MTTDICIIGAGPAGLSAAAFLHSTGLRVCVISDPQQACSLEHIQALPHFPGYRQHSGKSLLEKLRADASGAQFIEAAVKSCKSESIHSVELNNGQQVQARTVILALGAHRKNHPIDGENRFVGKGVYHCAKTYGSLSKGKPAVVVGKSMLAAESALLLAAFASHVYFVVPASKLDLSEKVLNDLRNQKNIEFMTTSSVKVISGNDKVEKVTVLSMGNEREIACGSVFPCLTEYTPHPCLQHFVKQNEQGAVLVDEQFQTSQPGVFACGDLLCNSQQLPLIATAQGLLCATHVVNNLQSS